MQDVTNFINIRRTKSSSCKMTWIFFLDSGSGPLIILWTSMANFDFDTGVPFQGQVVSRKNKNTSLTQHKDDVP